MRSLALSGHHPLLLQDAQDSVEQVGQPEQLRGTAVEQVSHEAQQVAEKLSGTRQRRRCGG